MINFKKRPIAHFLLISLLITSATAVNGSAEFVVYGIHQSVSLGNAGELAQKDYYINMGYLHGVRKGTVLEVMRRVPTFDLTNQKVNREMIFPFARIKVIHVESKSAIARLEKLLPAEEVPAAAPRAIIAGDVIRQLAR
jgi:hypothetical protein